MASRLLRIELVLVLVLMAAPARALDVVLDYSYDESGFFDDPARRAVLEHAVRLYTRSIDAELAALPQAEWAAVFPHPGRASGVVYRDLAVDRSTLHVFVGAHPRGAAAPARGVPGYVAWRCEDPATPGACAQDAARRSLAEQRSWIERFVFRSSAGAAAWPPRAFAPWGGALSFASDVDWYVGIDGPVPPDRLDLLSSAVRELGRILGVGTAPVWAVWAARAGFEAPAFTADLAPGRRLLLSATDEAALREIGWERGDRALASGQAPGAEVQLKGDIDGDARVDLGDLLLLEAYLIARASGADAGAADWVEARGSAADVAPMLQGDAIGDGKLDRADLDVLRAAIAKRDIDGDGLPTALENQRNARFTASAGSLLHHPLQRRPDQCAVLRGSSLLFFGPMGRPVPFCGADGRAWFDLPLIAWVIPGQDGLGYREWLDSVARAAGLHPGPRSGLRPGAWPPMLLVPQSAWSPYPAVSPELYVEIVRAEERAAALAPDAAAAMQTGMAPTRGPAATGSRTRKAEGSTPSAPRPPADLEASHRSAELPAAPSAPNPGDELLDSVAWPEPLAVQASVGARTAPVPELRRRSPRSVPQGLAPAEPAARDRAIEAAAPGSKAEPREFLAELLQALSAFWERLRSLLGL